VESVVVKKDRLLATLQENRKTHQEDFDIAWDAFKEKAIHNFQERLAVLKDLKKGQQVNLHVNLSIPINHVDDYDRAIAMLDWEVGDEVELQQHEFAQLIQDEWAWKAQFTASNVLYTGSASPSKR
jgi:hypothetical protein